MIGPLAKPAVTDASDLWCVPFQTKKDILGSQNLPLPGGSCPVEHDAESRPRGCELTPAFWHEGPFAAAAEVAHSLTPVALIDLSPGGGHFAFWCARHRVPYAAVCLTEAHKDHLTRRLVSRTISAMCDNSDEILFDNSFAQDLTVVAFLQLRLSVSS